MHTVKRGGSVAEWLACWTQAQKGLDLIAVATMSLYKSLLTENSVATQKHNSTSINTNKIQYKIQRSSPSQQLTLGTGVLTKYHI